MDDPLHVGFDIARAVGKTEGGAEASLVGKEIDKATIPMSVLYNTSEAAENEDIGSPASLSAGIAKIGMNTGGRQQAKDSNDGRPLDSSQNPAASTFKRGTVKTCTRAQE